MHHKGEIAPQDSKEWKCNWRKCAGGMGFRQWPLLFQGRMVEQGMSLFYN